MAVCETAVWVFDGLLPGWDFRPYSQESQGGVNEKGTSYHQNRSLKRLPMRRLFVHERQSISNEK